MSSHREIVKLPGRAVSINLASRNKNTYRVPEVGVCQTLGQLLLLAFVVMLGIGYSVAETVSVCVCGGGDGGEDGHPPHRSFRISSPPMLPPIPELLASRAGWKVLSVTLGPSLSTTSYTAMTSRSFPSGWGWGDSPQLGTRAMGSITCCYCKLGQTH